MPQNDKSKSRVSFIGLLSAGKSTALKTLVSKLNQNGNQYTIVSTDDIVIRRMKDPQDPVIMQFQRSTQILIDKSVFQSSSPTATFIALYGEPSFRDLEEQFVVDMIQNAPSHAFFDLGGKVPLREGLAAKLKASGVLMIYLDVNHQTILAHLSEDDSWQTRGIYKLAEEKGPGWKQLALQHRLERVEKYKVAADIILDANNKSPDDIASEALALIQKHFGLNFTTSFTLKSANSHLNQVLDGIKLGTGMMLMQAPVVNFFNNASVIACKKDLKWRQAYSEVYWRGASHSAYPSMLNFLCGIQAHLAKEAPRLLFKPAGLYSLKPWLDEHFSRQYAILLFASALSLAEILVNPADSIRVQRQSRKPVDYSFKTLRKGSLGNGTRQFFTWSLFSSVSGLVDENVLKPHKIDLSSPQAFAIKGILVATSLGLIYPIERVKNEIQYSTNPGGYVGTARSIYRRGGVSLLFCGVGPKIISNAIQATGASALVAMGSQKK